MKFKNVAGVAACSVLIAALVIPSHAAMKNITINDGRYSGSGWWGNREDNEVEPNNNTNQNWDLEGFFCDGKTLTVVGGFNFKNGYGGEYSGDVFVDINGGTPNKNGLNPSAYDYVINFDRTMTGKLTGNYVIKKLEGNYTLAPCVYAQNAGSNPWKLLVGRNDSRDRNSIL